MNPESLAASVKFPFNLRRRIQNDLFLRLRNRLMIPQHQGGR